MKIYLAGSVPKGDEEKVDFKNWRNYYKKDLSKRIEAIFVDPSDRDPNFNESDFLAVFGYDCRNIKDSDLIIVNCENKIGVGTSQEMVIAKYFKKPVITVLPKNSEHRKTNLVFRGKTIKDWIHPFIFAFSDVIVENVSEANNKLIEGIAPKDITAIDDSIKYFNNLP